MQHNNSYRIIHFQCDADLRVSIAFSLSLVGSTRIRICDFRFVSFTTIDHKMVLPFAILGFSFFFKLD